MKTYLIISALLVFLYLNMAGAAPTEELGTWNVTQALIYSDTGITKDEISAYTPITFEVLEDGSANAVIDDVNLTGNMIRENFYALKGKDEGLFIAKMDTNASMRLYIFAPAVNKTESQKGLTVLTLEKAEVTFDRGLLLGGFSSGLSAAESEAAEAGKAGVEGNTRFENNSAIACEKNSCTCEGETCSCTGTECGGEGADSSCNDGSCNCNGWDCYLTCYEGQDCKLSG